MRLPSRDRAALTDCPKGQVAGSLSAIASMWAAPVSAQSLAPPGTVTAYGLLMWLGFGIACTAAGALWVRQRLRLQQQRVQRDVETLIALSEHAVWRTDAEHRLLMWRPSPEAEGPAWQLANQQGQAFAQLFALEDDPEDALALRMAAGSTIGPLRAVLKSDGSRWLLRAQATLDAQGRVLGYLGTAQPLAPALQARHDKVLLSRLWGVMAQPTFLLQSEAQGWTVRQVSPAAQQLVGGEPGALLGQAWEAVRKALPPDMAQALERLEPGGVVTVAGWQARLVEVDAGSDLPASRLLCLSTEAKPQAQEDQESFVYSISHDLRAPIRVVEGFSRILKEDYGRFLDRIGNDHLDRVLAAAARMNSMIDALLALSRLQSQPLARKPVDLSQLATYILEDLRRDQPERAAEVLIEPGIIVQGDPTLLRVALENLLGNAWKYSSKCPQTRIEFKRELTEGQNTLVVADNGAGFDMRFADRLFGVFQRLHSAKDFQGTGVGLASVRRIIRRHGGDIWAESEVGQGARFYFTL
ncbi:sensor histidine kinase [Ideonella paludis]|uniref:histidine kinase n=1 Tax=Ideonella paludis TaxID=1233411 RepID=A0ABS5E1F3_9BURK|nr:ATP-binding protein [Ideonella paludis]MBQ0937232.1 GHKL domain-containing protein [Ideonella paludis]